MITTMVCVWWAIVIVLTGGFIYFVKRAWEEGRKTEGSEFFCYAVMALITLAIDILGLATLCALKYIGA